jgi:hypothetical protein
MEAERRLLTLLLGAGGHQQPDRVVGAAAAT